MRGRFNTRQRNYIILGLCSILLVMAAGYAAFSSRLTINGTSNITSEFKVLITDIQSSVLVGGQQMLKHQRIQRQLRHLKQI